MTILLSLDCSPEPGGPTWVVSRHSSTHARGLSEMADNLITIPSLKMRQASS